MMARNYEYKWIYSHPQVLYRSNFLLCYMLRLSARFLCCKKHKKISRFGTVKLNLKSCRNCKLANTEEPDFQIPHLLGFSSYYTDKPDSVFARQGYIFHRSSDSDIRVLFKRIMLENENLKENKSEEISRYFKAFFSRKHQRPLWKSRDEYEGIIKDFQPIQKDVIFRKLTGAEKSSQIAYKFAEAPISEVFQQNNLSDVVAVRSSLNTKTIDDDNTLIQSQRFGITRLCDIASEEILPKANRDFFFLYGDIDLDEPLSLKDIRSMLKLIFETSVVKD